MLAAGVEPASAEFYRITLPSRVPLSLRLHRPYTADPNLPGHSVNSPLQIFSVTTRRIPEREHHPDRLALPIDRGDTLRAYLPRACNSSHAQICIHEHGNDPERRCLQAGRLALRDDPGLVQRPDDGADSHTILAGYFPGVAALAVILGHRPATLGTFGMG